MEYKRTMLIPEKYIIVQCLLRILLLCALVILTPYVSVAQGLPDSCNGNALLRSECVALTTEQKCSKELNDHCCNCQKVWGITLNVCEFQDEQFKSPLKTPTPSPTFTPSHTPTATATSTPQRTPTVTRTPTIIIIPTLTVSPTPTPLPGTPKPTFTPGFVCSDGLDNDRDGFTDYPVDTGCASASDTNETDNSRACDNGVDDDGDRAIDIADNGCSNPTDLSETTQTNENGEIIVDVAAEVIEISNVLLLLKNLVIEQVTSIQDSCKKKSDSSKVLRSTGHIAEEFESVILLMTDLHRAYPAQCSVGKGISPTNGSRNTPIACSNEEDDSDEHDCNKSKRMLELFYRSNKANNSEEKIYSEHKDQQSQSCATTRYASKLCSVASKLATLSHKVAKLLSRYKGEKCSQSQVLELIVFLERATTEVAARIRMLPTECRTCIQNERVTICHKNRETLSLPKSAIKAHLAHGDYLGICRK